MSAHPQPETAAQAPGEPTPATAGDSSLLLLVPDTTSGVGQPRSSGAPTAAAADAAGAKTDDAIVLNASVRLTHRQFPSARAGEVAAKALDAAQRYYRLFYAYADGRGDASADSHLLQRRRRDEEAPPGPRPALESAQPLADGAGGHGGAHTPAGTKEGGARRSRRRLEKSSEDEESEEEEEETDAGEEEEEEEGFSTSFGSASYVLHSPTRAKTGGGFPVNVSGGGSGSNSAAAASAAAPQAAEAPSARRPAPSARANHFYTNEVPAGSPVNVENSYFHTFFPPVLQPSDRRKVIEAVLHHPPRPFSRWRWRRARIVSGTTAAAASGAASPEAPRSGKSGRSTAAAATASRTADGETRTAVADAASASTAGGSLARSSEGAEAADTPPATSSTATDSNQRSTDFLTRVLRFVLGNAQQQQQQQQQQQGVAGAASAPVTPEASTNTATAGDALASSAAASGELGMTVAAAAAMASSPPAAAAAAPRHMHPSPSFMQSLQPPPPPSSTLGTDLPAGGAAADADLMPMLWDQPLESQFKMPTSLTGPSYFAKRNYAADTAEGTEGGGGGDGGGASGPPNLSFSTHAPNTLRPSVPSAGAAAADVAAPLPGPQTGKPLAPCQYSAVSLEALAEMDDGVLASFGHNATGYRPGAESSKNATPPPQSAAQPAVASTPPPDAAAVAAATVPRRAPRTIYEEESHSLCIVMVGLPARGKTFLAQKICRLLNWHGVSAKVLNVQVAWRSMLLEYEKLQLRRAAEQEQLQEQAAESEAGESAEKQGKETRGGESAETSAPATGAATMGETGGRSDNNNETSCPSADSLAASGAVRRLSSGVAVPQPSQTELASMLEGEWVRRYGEAGFSPRDSPMASAGGKSRRVASNGSPTSAGTPQLPPALSGSVRSTAAAAASTAPCPSMAADTDAAAPMLTSGPNTPAVAAGATSAFAQPPPRGTPAPASRTASAAAAATDGQRASPRGAASPSPGATPVLRFEHFEALMREPDSAARRVYRYVLDRFARDSADFFARQGGEVVIVNDDFATAELRREALVRFGPRCSQTLFMEVVRDAELNKKFDACKVRDPTEYPKSGISLQEARADFDRRVQLLNDLYEPVGSGSPAAAATREGPAEDGFGHIRIINSRVIESRNVRGVLANRIVGYAMNMAQQKVQHPIYFVRHGESCYNLEDRIGGDPLLTSQGLRDAAALLEFLASLKTHLAHIERVHLRRSQHLAAAAAASGSAPASQVRARGGPQRPQPAPSPSPPSGGCASCEDGFPIHSLPAAGRAAPQHFQDPCGASTPAASSSFAARRATQPHVDLTDTNFLHPANLQSTADALQQQLEKSTTNSEASGSARQPPTPGGEEAAPATASTTTAAAAAPGSPHARNPLGSLLAPQSGGGQQQQQQHLLQTYNYAVTSSISGVASATTTPPESPPMTLDEGTAYAARGGQAASCAVTVGTTAGAGAGTTADPHFHSSGARALQPVGAFSEAPGEGGDTRPASATPDATRQAPHLPLTQQQSAASANNHTHARGSLDGSEPAVPLSPFTPGRPRHARGGGGAAVAPSSSPHHGDLEAHSNAHRLELWTSQLRRAIQTAELSERLLNIRTLRWSSLNEIHGGICEGMTYRDVERLYPSISTFRRQNKYTFRYPEGESYQDLVQRLEPVIMELENADRVVVVVAHQAVLRCLLGYYSGASAEHSVMADVPHRTVWRCTYNSKGIASLEELLLDNYEVGFHSSSSSDNDEAAEAGAGADGNDGCAAAAANETGENGKR